MPFLIFRIIILSILCDFVTENEILQIFFREVKIIFPIDNHVMMRYNIIKETKNQRKMRE